MVSHFSTQRALRKISFWEGSGKYHFFLVKGLEGPKTLLREHGDHPSDSFDWAIGLLRIIWATSTILRDFHGVSENFWALQGHAWECWGFLWLYLAKLRWPHGSRVKLGSATHKHVSFSHSAFPVLRKVISVKPGRSWFARKIKSL